jgi:hypothetical protein
MKRRKGVDTFADRNSPSIVCTYKKQSRGCLKIEALTIERTIIESFGSGVI